MPPKKAAKGYKRPEPIPKNEVLRDTLKRNWILGPSIGVGGFGEIYSAAEGDTPLKDVSKYSYVVKIEPHENGPLFVERNFYMRVAKKDDVDEFMKKKKLKTFGMPVLHGSGSHEYNKIKYRFIVMDRYATDLATLFTNCSRVFSLPTVLRISIQVLDVLEFIHSKDFVHADIKAANLLLGLKKGTENQVYVVDFGLASRINTGEYKFNPKKAHNGTIEYTSTDAHFGVSTRRGDMEILLYNMVEWLTSKLPWENLSDCPKVADQKKAAMSKVSDFLKKCFGNKQIPDAISKFATNVSKLNHDDVPNYSQLRGILTDGLKSFGKVDGPLDFSIEEQENIVVPAVKGARAKTTKKSGEGKRTITDITDKTDAAGPERKKIRKTASTKKSPTSKPPKKSSPSSTTAKKKPSSTETTRKKSPSSKSPASPKEKKTAEESQPVKVNSVEENITKHTSRAGEYHSKALPGSPKKMKRK